MHHTVSHFHGVTLHDAPVMVPLFFLALLVVIVLVPLMVRESLRAGADTTTDTAQEA